MATISKLLWLRHLRSTPSHHVLQFQGGRLKRQGRGLTFWFWPLTASIAEIPCDDREQPFVFHCRTRDFQDVSVQGAITYRIVDPVEMANRFDFSLHLDSGRHVETPLEKLAQLLTQAAQQLTVQQVAAVTLEEAVARGVSAIREHVQQGLGSDTDLSALGLQIVAVRIAEVSPEPELERALQAPTRESIQQASDEATFQRRALAVEKERAIAENELNNKIQLARREQELITQRGTNRQQNAEQRAAARRIDAESDADNQRILNAAEADGIRLIEDARRDGDARFVEIYRDVPVSVLVGLAARELAGNLRQIDHLNLSGDSLQPLLNALMASGVQRLEE